MSGVARRKVICDAGRFLIEGQVAWSDASAPARLPNLYFQRPACYCIIQRIKTSAESNINLFSRFQFIF